MTVTQEATRPEEEIKTYGEVPAVLPILPFLWKTKWDHIAQCWSSFYKPRAVVIATKEEREKFQAGRLTVFVTNLESLKIKRMELEALIALPFLVKRDPSSPIPTLSDLMQATITKMMEAQTDPCRYFSFTHPLGQTSSQPDPRSLATEKALSPAPSKKDPPAHHP